MQLLVIQLLFLAYASTAFGQAAEWAQCGGQGWTGATTCASGLQCVYKTSTWSRCEQGTDSGSSSTSGQAAEWAQCGGQGWTGATTCASGLQCVYQTDTWSRCEQGTDSGSSSTAGQAAEWAQCGGQGWTGATTCASGLQCVYKTSTWSRCEQGTGSGASETPVSPVAIPTPSSSPGSGSQQSGGGGSLASSSDYTPVSESSCGCQIGTQAGAPAGVYFGATTANLFGQTKVSSTWCGSACGKCFQLTNTGAAPPGEGTGNQPTNSIILMITDLCPASLSPKWCSIPDAYGYGAHFDVINPPSGWMNPIVEYAPIDCPSSVAAPFNTCQCANGGS